MNKYTKPIAALLLFMLFSYSTKSLMAQNDKTITVNGVSFVMKMVEGGTFQMGATPEQGDYYSKLRDIALPVHKVSLSSYYIGETEVTQALLIAVMGSALGTGPTDAHYWGRWTANSGVGNKYPAYCVSWDKAQEFIVKLNELTGMNFRLPTEAEWEYAARGGRKSKGYKYAGGNNLDDIAWHSGNNNYTNHRVKLKRPNELGIYDMTGNVMEWCSDYYGKYSSEPQTNPQGAPSGNKRVIRGGDSALSNAISVRAYFAPDTSGVNFIGFRLALSK